MWQTGSGKTYTMSGRQDFVLRQEAIQECDTEAESSVESSVDVQTLLMQLLEDDSRGLVPRILQKLLHRIGEVSDVP